jgi:3-oxoacyl-[acyl-carrier protein] reductase
MKKNRWGRVINISSSAGKMGGPISSIHYSASKAAVICMTKSFARYLAPFNITVNSLCPGVVETGMVQQLPEEVRRKAIEAIPVGRFAKPIEIAQVALFLCSEEASYITGEILDVNGGTVMD